MKKEVIEVRMDKLSWKGYTLLSCSQFCWVWNKFCLFLWRKKNDLMNARRKIFRIRMFVKLGKLACVKSSKVLTSQNKARTKKRNFCKWWKHIFQPTVSDGKWHWLSPLMFTLGKRKKRERKWTVWQENTGVITNSIKKNKISQPLSNHYWFNYYSSKITLFVNDFFFEKKVALYRKDTSKTVSFRNLT